MIDPAVGLVMHKKLGDSVARGEPYCTIHYNSEARLAEARALIEQACEFTEGPPASLPPLVYQVLGL
jgi:thymidine phosphorylase